MSRTRTWLILVTGLLVGAILAPIGALSAGSETDSASGVVVIKEGKRCKKVSPEMNVNRRTKVTATMLTPVASNSVRNVRRLVSDDKFKVCLAAEASRNIKVAWIAHNGSALADANSLTALESRIAALEAANLGSRVGALESDIADLGDTQPGIAFSYNTIPTDLTGPGAIDRIAQTSIRVPDDGYLVVQVSGYYAVSTSGNDSAYCQFTKGAKRTSLNVLSPSPDPWFPLEDFGTNGSVSHFSGHAVIEVSEADNPVLGQVGQAIGVDCLEVAGSVETDDVSLTVTYTRTKYAPKTIKAP